MKEKIEQIKQKALQDHVPILMDNTLEIMREILLENKPKDILEIGTATGYSAICFSDILENKCHIDTIELSELRANKAKENIKNLGLENNINVLIGDAVEILPTINKKYDMIFIDASKGKYPIFLEQALRLTAKGSIIIADNVLYKGYVMSDYNKHKQRTAVRNLREFIQEITTNKNMETKILEVGDGLAISKIREEKPTLKC